MEEYILNEMKRQKIGWDHMSLKKPSPKINFAGIPAVSICVQGEAKRIHACIYTAIYCFDATHGCMPCVAALAIPAVSICVQGLAHLLIYVFSATVVFHCNSLLKCMCA